MTRHLAIVLCAWVLWTESQMFGSRSSAEPTWTAQRAVTSAEECEAARVAYVTNAERMGYRVVGSMVVRDAGALGHHAITVSCLPDTIDPRGPKR